MKVRLYHIRDNNYEAEFWSSDPPLLSTETLVGTMTLDPKQLREGMVKGHWFTQTDVDFIRKELKKKTVKVKTHKRRKR